MESGEVDDGPSWAAELARYEAEEEERPSSLALNSPEHSLFGRARRLKELVHDSPETAGEAAPAPSARAAVRPTPAGRDYLADRRLSHVPYALLRGFVAAKLESREAEADWKSFASRQKRRLSPTEGLRAFTSCTSVLSLALLAEQMSIDLEPFFFRCRVRARQEAAARAEASEGTSSSVAPAADAPSFEDSAMGGDESGDEATGSDLEVDASADVRAQCPWEAYKPSVASGFLCITGPSLCRTSLAAYPPAHSTRTLSYIWAPTHPDIDGIRHSKRNVSKRRRRTNERCSSE